MLEQQDYMIMKRYMAPSKDPFRWALSRSDVLLAIDLYEEGLNLYQIGDILLERKGHTLESML